MIRSSAIALGAIASLAAGCPRAHPGRDAGTDAQIDAADAEIERDAACPPVDAGPLPDAGTEIECWFAVDCPDSLPFCCEEGETWRICEKDGRGNCNEKPPCGAFPTPSCTPNSCPREAPYCCQLGDDDPPYCSPRHLMAWTCDLE